MIEHQGDSQNEVHEQVARAKAFLRRMRRFWRTPALLVVLGGAAAAVFLLIRTPKYRSETVILYSEGVRAMDDVERPESAKSVTVRLKEILMSRASLDAVAREFDLYPEIRRDRGAVDAVEELRKHVEFRAPGGDTFSVAFTGTSPTQAQAVTARLASLVIGQDADLRKKQAILLRDFLVAEKQTTEARLRDTETALASFMAEHPRFALDATPLATGAAIRASLGAAAAVVPPQGGGWARRRLAPRGPDEPAPPVSRPPANSAVLRAATEEESRASAALVAADANLSDLSGHFTAAHPDVRAARAEVERARSRLSAAKTAVLAAQAAGAAPASAPPASADDAVSLAPPAPVPARPPSVTPAPEPRPVVAAAVTPRAPQDVVALETQWVKLTRSVTEAREHQDQIEGALFKANAAVSSESGGQGVQVTMIDPAFLPQSAVPPGRGLIAALFVAGAFVLGLLGASLRALLDDGIYEARDVTRFAGLLVEVPRASSGRRHVSS